MKNSRAAETSSAALARDRARELRADGTEAERKLWIRLRNGQLRGAKFRRQHPVGSYIADFFCLEARLVVELDGGGHGEDEQRHADARRTAYLERSGYRVVRFWNNEVLGNVEGVLARIEEYL